MLESIRARLLLWYSVLLVLLVLLYAATVTYLYSQSLQRDMDADLAATAAVISGSITPDASGALDLSLPPGFRDPPPGGDTDTATYYAVWNARGDLVDRSGEMAVDEGAPPEGATTRDGMRRLVTGGQGDSRILVARPMAAQNAAVRSLAATVAGAGILVLLLSTAGGLFLAGQALAPVARISSTARRMVQGDFEARIPVERTHTELEQVAVALNAAFDSMLDAANRQRQFVSDASHELRTPIAVLRAELDWAMKQRRSAEEYEASAAQLSEAVDRLASIATGLLSLATAAESPAVAALRQPVDIAAVLGQAVRILTPLANSRTVTLTIDAPPLGTAPATIQGVPNRLLDAFLNIVKNGIEYNRAGGAVAVAVRSEGGHVVIRISDTGAGIPPGDVARIFDRFYRADTSRSREAGGAGLGLSIAKAVVEEHGGTIACSSHPGAGSEFVVRLPHAST